MSFVESIVKLDEITGEISPTKFDKTLNHLRNLKTRTRDLLKYISFLPEEEKIKYYYLLKDRFKNIDTVIQHSQLAPDLYDKIYSCHTYLKFHHYLEIDKYKLVDAKHCDQHLLCPICAIRRATKKLKIYQDKTNAILKDYKDSGIDINLYHIVLTVKHNNDLAERYNHIKSVLKKLLHRRRLAKSISKKSTNYAKDSMFSGSVGGVYSIEVKRGKRSKLWHPHIHLLLLTPKTLNYQSIYDEYARVTTDSKNIKIIKVETDNLQKQFYELFKYALKFSDMNFSDNLIAFELLRGKRLVGSFGDYRGLDVVADELEDELQLIYEFLELHFKYDGASKSYKMVAVDGLELKEAM